MHDSQEFDSEEVGSNSSWLVRTCIVLSILVCIGKIIGVRYDPDLRDHDRPMLYVMWVGITIIATVYFLIVPKLLYALHLKSETVSLLTILLPGAIGIFSAKHALP